LRLYRATRRNQLKKTNIGFYIREYNDSLRYSWHNSLNTIKKTLGDDFLSCKLIALRKQVEIRQMTTAEKSNGHHTQTLIYRVLSLPNRDHVTNTWLSYTNKERKKYRRSWQSVGKSHTKTERKLYDWHDASFHLSQINPQMKVVMAENFRH